MKLKPNKEKVLETILYLVHEGERRKRPLTQYQIVKSIFLADTQHLERYGRPVTFDNYSALMFGPVPELAYDMLKPSFDWNSFYGESGAPWERNQVTSNAYEYIRPTRDPDLRQLSKTDVTALDEAIEIVYELGFGGIVDHTHQHPAYKEAWENRGGAKAKQMKYLLLLRQPDEREAEALVYASAHS